MRYNETAEYKGALAQLVLDECILREQNAARLSFRFLGPRHYNGK